MRAECTELVAYEENGPAAPTRMQPVEESREDEKAKGLTKQQQERIAKNREAARRKRHGVGIKMHPINEQWCHDEKEAKFTRKVQGFLSKLRWKEADDEEGGITWIELYALYSTHGGSRDEDDRRGAGILDPPLCCRHS